MSGTSRERSESLTGVWHGLYSYPGLGEPVAFVATLLQVGTSLSGTTHETVTDYGPAPFTCYAILEGEREGAGVSFTKTYDGTSGWNHSVFYAGAVGDDGLEIEGRWSIPFASSGRFLMIRSEGPRAAVIREAFERV